MIPLKPEDPGLVWHSVLDERYIVQVQRNGADGVLCIFDPLDGNKELMSEQTAMMYEARYGPDVDDVARWEDRAAAVVDKLNKRNVDNPDAV